MRILLFDTTLYSPSSPLFLEALRDSGLEYSFFDEAPYLAPLMKSPVHKIARRVLGGRPLTASSLNRDLLKQCRRFRPDTVLIVKGAYVRAETLAEIKQISGAQLVNFATDDPFNPANSTGDLLASIPHYDLYVCTKKAIMPDVLSAGAQRVCFVPFAYHPGVHFPEECATAEERARFSCDVAFIGGADKDRFDFVGALSKAANLKLNLYGGSWGRIRAFRKVSHGFVYGREYRLAISGAKVLVGLVRRANRDGHAMRTFEIPACRGFMLAEKTEEHQEFLREREQTDFFSSAEDLVDKSLYYLGHREERQRIARAGHAAVTSGKNTYADRLRQIISFIPNESPSVDESSGTHPAQPIKLNSSILSWSGAA